MNHTRQSPKRFLTSVLTVLLFLSVTASALNGLIRMPIHIDEHEWIRRGIYLFDAGFIRRDYADPIWTDFISIDQTTLGEYLYGFWTMAVYRRNPVTLMRELAFNDTYGGTYSDSYGDLWNPRAWWIGYAQIPNPDSYLPESYRAAFRIIVVNRFLSALFFIGTAVCVFGMIHLLYGFTPAVIGTILYTSMPMHTPHSRQAMLGSIITFFIALTAYVFIRAHPGRPHWKRYILPLGIGAGAAAATRIDGFAVIIVIAVICGIEGLRALRTPARAGVRNAVLTALPAAVLCALVVYVLNPFLWRNPVANLLTVYEARQTYTVHVLAQKLTPQLATRGIGQQFYTVARHMVLPFAGSRYWPVALLGIITFSAGILSLARTVRRMPAYDSRTRLSLFALGLYVCMSLYISVNYSRYYLPILPFSAVIHTAGILALTSRFRRLMEGITRTKNVL